MIYIKNIKEWADQHIWAYRYIWDNRYMWTVRILLGGLAFAAILTLTPLLNLGIEPYLRFEYYEPLTVKIMIAIFLLCGGYQLHMDKRKKISWLGLGLVLLLGGFLFCSGRKLTGEWDPEIRFILFTILFGMLIARNDKVLARMECSLYIGANIVTLGMTIFNILNRPMTDSGRYLGPFLNPNALGLYTALLFAILLACLNSMIEKKVHVAGIIVQTLILIICCFWLAMSQSRNAMVSITLTSFVWLIILLCRKIQKQERVQIWKIAGILAAVMVGLIVSGILYDILRERTLAGDNAMAFDSDIYGIGVTGDINLLDRLLSTVRSLLENHDGQEALGARYKIYQIVLQNLNKWGHLSVLIEGEGISVSGTHNAILHYFYRYGIPAGLAYTAVIFWGLCRAIQSMWTRRKDLRAALILIFLANVTCGFFESASAMVYHVAPLFFWMTVGCWLIKLPPQKKKRKK